MKILLLGEYSNVHWTLAEGLRALGHEVTVVSNGDFWKNYPRDIDIARPSSRLGGMAYMARLAAIMPRLRGFDIVQIINPMFVELKAHWIKPIYNYLRRHNRHIVMCAFGMDYYWVNTCCTSTAFRYSDFNIGSKQRTNADALKERHDWIGTSKERLNKYIAADCDAIVAGLYEYWRCYAPCFPKKTTYIPFPIKCSSLPERHTDEDGKIKVFIGINRTRSEYKGTDIMLRAARDVEQKHTDHMSLVVAESVPFATYCKLMEGSDAILDQLYSYTPAMNSLQAMSRGIVCIGGGEPENYDIIGEKELRPIVNVQPNYDSVHDALESLVAQPEKVRKLQRESVEYIKKHHDYIKVAKQYEALYNGLCNVDGRRKEE